MKVKVYKSLFWICMSLYSTLYAQKMQPSNGEVAHNKNVTYYLKNATLWIDYQTQQANSSLTFRNGIIEAINEAAPKDAIIIDLKGKFVYPSFIDVYTNYGMPEIKATPYNPQPQYDSKIKGAFHWNENIKAEFKAAEVFEIDEKKLDEFQKLGFGAVLSHQPNGIVRGTGVLVSLGKQKENFVILKKDASAHLSLRNANSNQEYPSSLMGRIALLRQTYLDADWYNKYQGADKEMNLSLVAFQQIQSLPQFFEANGKLNILRADKIGDEFGKQYIFKGAGDEYQRLEEIKNTKATLIIPLNFPDAYDVEDVYAADAIALEDMKHWELAPHNPRILAEANINFAFTASDLSNKSLFISNLRKSVELGLDKKIALKALTFTPAQILGVENQLGSLKKGMAANFLVVSKDIFEKDAIIYENWVQGEKYTLNEISSLNLAGNYQLQIGSETYDLNVEGEINPKFSLKSKTDTNKITLKTQIQENWITMSFAANKAQNQQLIRLSGWIEGKNWQGKAELPNGNSSTWKATWLSETKAQNPIQKPQNTSPKEEIGKVIFPFLSYGNEKKPTQEDILFKNATVWTNEKEGVLKNTDVLVKNGKIAKIGSNIAEKNVKIIDATNKHLTTGIIDEHSHIALSAVNEGSQAVTAECRMADAINSEDMSIYSNLAGGVTMVQLLHGSANPIGAQSALIRLKWGENPENLQVAWADGFIKFALGENVKQSNWGDYYTVRFPQTRMGVEQVMIDAFTRAKEYEKAKEEAFKNKKNPKVFRRDLEAETLLEIVNKKRFITCHSYVQSEINMLMKVAEKFGFRVNTFTHILEGYKLADKMAAHGAAGSTFADWWAYKNEVKEAIPFNAALMHQNGVLVAINSDDPEMSRRLNQEAAKIIKYGNISEEDAWKMITLNPAKMLHIDSRVGSIKVGKDADLVLWSANPLSIYAKAEKTMIEGTFYFEIEKDEAQRQYIKTERARLIQKMLHAKAGGATLQTPLIKKRHIFHCEDTHEQE
ncbi:MAG: amidohydrolase family protein [Thermonemataceae bacterium]|nr:amidohydrolase family protein [Thermonemataceae bacterium]